MKKKIYDWGPIVPGDRKHEDYDQRFLKDMPAEEFQALSRKSKEWSAIAPKKAIADGEPIFLVYWKREIRKLAYRHPAFAGDDTEKEVKSKCRKYTRCLLNLRNRVLTVESEEEIGEFYSELKEMDNFRATYGAAISKGHLLDTEEKIGQWRLDCQNSEFPEHLRKGSGKRKKLFVLPKIEPKRIGPDYLNGKRVTKNLWKTTLNFHSVQFGNYVTQKERRAFLNDYMYAYMDLSNALDIPVGDISFGHHLSMAYGARGCSRAAAHYEPACEIINLTKTRGAGCLAHEWCHAMDDMLAKHCGITSGRLASESIDTCEHLLPHSFVKLVRMLQVDENGNHTDFYRGSAKMDGVYAKDSHGYWASRCEMLARAFACYVKDVLGFQTDFLIAYADCYEFTYDDERVCAIPQGDEREMFNNLFDQLFFELREIGFFTKNQIELFDEEPSKPAIEEAAVVKAATPVKVDREIRHVG